MSKDMFTKIYRSQLNEELETDNVMFKYAVCGKKNTSIVGHLPLGKNGKFAKIVFYFLRAD